RETAVGATAAASCPRPWWPPSDDSASPWVARRGTLRARPDWLRPLAQRRLGCWQRGSEWLKDAGGDGVGDAEHSEQDVFVADGLCAGMVDGEGERHLRARADAEAAGVRPFERSRP